MLRHYHLQLLQHYKHFASIEAHWKGRLFSCRLDVSLPKSIQFNANDFAVSGTGAYACQLAKNVFRAGKVITTVSTAKIPKIPQLLGDGIVDQSQYWEVYAFLAVLT